ncbi:hypothetical protein RFI_05213 [Reticulomyxa filosa]|uniref:peptidylprolyl isomerase n=1 Tax=Reticulomyxa filosa TaxID=46433 RepID=X6P1G6_RETFI|nr:hypothetical protein RFI_05213 [Reticulomyxa filosa]|eukprot:ETO31904.1 hypothetical protein RFI_05213 [Reticulomyxa filosa]
MAKLLNETEAQDLIRVKKRKNFPKFEKPKQDIKAKILEKSDSKIKCKDNDKITLSFNTYVYGGDKHGLLLDSNTNWTGVIGRYELFSPWEKVIKEIALGDKVRVITSQKHSHLYSLPSAKHDTPQLDLESQHLLAELDLLSINDQWRTIKPLEKETGDENTKIEKGDLVSVEYSGFFHGGSKHGEMFDSNNKPQAKPLFFRVGEGKVIKGWDESVTKLCLRSKAKLYISANYAYGDKGTPDKTVPKNQDLIFEIKVLEVKKRES